MKFNQNSETFWGTYHYSDSHNWAILERTDGKFIPLYKAQDGTYQSSGRSYNSFQEATENIPMLEIEFAPLVKLADKSNTERSAIQNCYHYLYHDDDGIHFGIRWNMEKEIVIDANGNFIKGSLHLEELVADYY